MKQKVLAEKLQISQSSIVHYIRGDILPALNTLADLCKILDVGTNYILSPLRIVPVEKTARFTLLFLVFHFCSPL